MKLKSDNTFSVNI